MRLNNPVLIDMEAALLARVRTDGGFGQQHGGFSRTDATAWAIIALSSLDSNMRCIQPAIARLTADQLSDGRIGISSGHPDAFWPTSIAILAWLRLPGYSQYHTRATRFLLETTGRHWKKAANDPMGHNPAIKGWPWIAETHSWVESTAISIIALRGAGYSEHPRTEEGTRMLMDRQLPNGGWNCGNTIVFGQELRSAPESTGTALHALAGLVPREKIRRSLDYLSAQITRLRTPISLGWSLLALNSWGVRITNAPSMIEECLKRQERYGPYDTTSLCLLVLPLVSPNGLLTKSAEA